MNFDREPVETSEIAGLALEADAPLHVVRRVLRALGQRPMPIQRRLIDSAGERTSPDARPR